VNTLLQVHRIKFVYWFWQVGGFLNKTKQPRLFYSIFKDQVLNKYKLLLTLDKELILNSDSQQFHQYQRNEQPLLNANHSTQKEIVRYVTRNPGPSTYAIKTDVL
jgi:hypothetical protein